MSVPWQQGTPWQAQPWMQQQPPLNQPPAWAGATAAVSPTLWQQATATQPQGGTQAPPTWAGGQAGPTWAAADPGAQQSLGGAPWMANAKTSDTDLSKAPLPGAASSQGLTQDAPYTWTGAAQSPNAGGALATMPAKGATDPNGNDAEWFNHIPGFTRGGGYPIGQAYNEATKTWTPKGPQAAGTLIGHEVGWKTPLYLPATYNPGGDTSSFEASTGPEQAVQRAIRDTADYARAHAGTNAQHYFEYMLANLTRDQGARTGFDPSQFAQTGYGEAYDPNKTYMAPGVMNPWTGKQAGNAQGVPTPSVAQQGGGLTTVPTRTNSNTPYNPTPTTSLPGTQTQDPAPVTQQPTTPTGGTSHSFGQFQTNDLASLLQAAANDPDRAAQILRLAQGQTGRPLGRMADFRDSLYGRSLQTALSLAGTDGQKDLQGIANDFLNQGVLGNDLIGYTGNQARQALGQDFSGVDSATMEKILRAALAEQGINMGSLGGSVQQGRLDDIVYDDWARNLGDKNNDTKNFADLLNGSRFQQSMANYGRR